MEIKEIIKLQDRFCELMGLIGMGPAMEEAILIAIKYYQDNIEKETVDK